MTKKQQAKLKRQFQYLKKQFIDAGIDVSKLKYSDLEQKQFKSIDRMRAKILEKSGVLSDMKIVVRQNNIITVQHEHMSAPKIFNVKRFNSDPSYIDSLYLDENGIDVRNYIEKEDEFISYQSAYYDYGVRVDDYNLSAFYELYSGIWDNTQAGYWLSELVEKAKVDDGSIEADFLTQDLKITDYKYYIFKNKRGA